MDKLFRHRAACNNAVLPGGRTALHIGGQPVGYAEPGIVPALIEGGATPCAGGLSVEPGQLQPIARALSDAGRFRWRGEDFDVRATPDGPALTQVDRGALPSFGIQAAGVHLNALVRRPSGLHLWVARRARDKLLDPGKLDHLVAGGIPAGLTPWETLLKEADEEAGLPHALLAEARETAVIDYAMARNEGLRRDRLHCFDVTLPETFVPEPRDGEVEAFYLWPVADVLDRVCATDDFKFNVNLVLIDLFERLGLLPSR